MASSGTAGSRGGGGGAPPGRLARAGGILVRRIRVGVRGATRPVSSGTPMPVIIIIIIISSISIIVIIIK